MRLAELKQVLTHLDNITFLLPDGTRVPQHFHVTEVGHITKRFVDCGGTLRNEEVINFQLWTAQDFDHRLAPKKLMDIIALSEQQLGLKDGEIEVEYQGATIGKYGLDFNGTQFMLLPKMTDCLAPEKCGVPLAKQKVSLSSLGKESSCCTPGSGCC